MKAARLSTALIFAGLAFAQHPWKKISSEFDNVDPRSKINVIVQFDQTPTEAHHNKIRTRGGILRRTADSIRVGAYSIPASAVADLNRSTSRIGQ
jgi:hypothetical protein